MKYLGTLATILLQLVAGPVWSQSNSVFLKKSFQDSVQAPVVGASASTMQNPVKKSRSKFSGDWKAHLVNQSGRDEFNQRNVLEMQMVVGLNYRLNESLRLNLTPSFTYLNGYTQTEARETSDSSQWSVKNADVTLFPNEIIELRAGALNQAHFHSALLITDRAFPSVALTLQNAPSKSTRNSLRFGLRGQSAIATSSSLSTETEDLEPTPTFTSAGTFLEIKNRVLETRLRLNAFRFNNLPRSVATPSVLRGNSALDENDQNLTDSDFKYEYQGTDASLDLAVAMGSYLRPNLKAAAVRNEKAPKSQNLGTTLKVGLEIMPSDAWSFTPFYRYSRIESDAAVAGYNSTTFETNRVGYAGGIEIQIQKSFLVSVSGGERDVLVESASQFRERFWRLGLETFNVSL